MSEHHHHHHGGHHGEGGGYPGGQGGYPGGQAGYPGGQGGYPGGQGGYPGGQGGYPGGQGGYPGGQGGVGAGGHFYIVSEMNGRVLDIKGGNKSAGTHLLVYDKDPGKAANQLWHLDSQGNIRSDMNEMTFAADKDGHVLKTKFADNSIESQWKFHGNQIVNGAGKNLDIIKGDKSNGAEVTAYHYNGAVNQHWRQEFV